MLKIIKKNKYEKLSNHEKNELLRYFKPIYNPKFDNYIYKFILTLSQYPNIDLDLFYENLKTLEIYKVRNFNESIFKKSVTRAKYLITINKILVMKTDDFYYIYHELLHCASTKQTDEKFICGFNTISSNDPDDYETIRGIGLTEGYTALLTSRYFGHIYHSENEGYPIEKFIASMLEIIVDNGRLEQFYFNADVSGLINYLNEFCELKDIHSFIYYLDLIHKIGTKNIENVSEMYEYIGYFLTKAYINKLLILAKKKELVKAQYLKLTNRFENILENNIVTCYNKKYKFLSNDLIIKIYDEIMNKPNNQKIKK